MVRPLGDIGCETTECYLLSIIAKTTTVSVGEFGPGIVVFRQYNRVGPDLNFENPPNVPLHIGARLPEFHHVHVGTVYNYKFPCRQQIYARKATKKLCILF